MMLTILKMMENGINDFSMVHDSYACHAADAEVMDGLIWEAFTEMYGTEEKSITISELLSRKAWITIKTLTIQYIPIYSG